MQSSTRIILLVLASLLISACDPTYESTEEKCANVRDQAVRATVDGFEVLTADNSYKLLLEDILTAFQAAVDAEYLDADGTPLADQAEAQVAIDNLQAKINEFLNYQVVDGEVISANNPIDFLEDLINTTDPSRVIDFFVSAKQQIDQAINDDDGYCDIQNRNIVIDSVDGNQELTVTARFYYEPFNRLYTQDENISYSVTDPMTSETESSQYTVLTQLEGDNFNKNEYSQPPLVRQALIVNADADEQLSVDDGFDIKLGQVEFIAVDTYCDDDEEERYPTAAGVDPSGYDNCTTETPRAPQKDQCMGIGDGSIDETNKIEANSYNLNADYSEIKRFRLETDFTTGEVRLYASEFTEAIYDSDELEENVIYDPTACEEQAVIDELRDIDEALPEPQGGPYTVKRYEDPNYDILRDDEGNVIEPTPIITFQGTILPERQ